MLNHDHRRRFAAGAACLVPAGAVTMLVALVAAPGSWLTGYVSEAAVAGLPFAATYRWGFFGVACGVALLAGAVGPVVRFAGPVLGVAAGLAATSAAVPCSVGCPLPPYERASLTDLVHGGASIVGLVLLAGAMGLTVIDHRTGPVQRRLAAVSGVVIVPVGAALALTMLIAGRHPLGAALERVALVVAVAWLTGTALVASLPAGPIGGRPRPRDHARVES
ncbi:DUF998 domain-containing protein [Symbioplanes lichenis]|uniref:DUF998 domain-containing protein n=1 Tax=Symbioplanes lichenis TaxID=1629072 RepID=UPI002739F441|nr:DUF998 domain-containing protein [Actinoplanes lichenis]